MENERDIDTYIAIRNLIQSKYRGFGGSTVDDVQGLKELSVYPGKLIAHELEKCVSERVTLEHILPELLKGIKALTYHAPTESERDEFYAKHQSKSSHRCLELLESGLSYAELKPIIYCVLETMRDDEILRTDRPLPTDPKFQWQIPSIKGMNDSDADYIERIDLYKNEHDIPLTERILLTPLQSQWLDYINGEDDKPMPIESKRQGIAIVKPNGDIDDLDDELPF